MFLAGIHLGRLAVGQMHDALVDVWFHDQRDHDMVSVHELDSLRRHRAEIRIVTFHRWMEH